MKIDDYIKHPAGKGAIIPGKDIIISNWDYRFELLQKNKEDELTCTIYTNGTNVYYHFIIPTENKDRKNTYDIILKFKQTKDSDKSDTSYRQYEIEFFSNCPSFTYGYAYVANLNGYLIKEFADRYDEKVLKYPPVSKNPGLIFGYEKSIYFACKYLLDKKVMLMKSYVEANSKPMTKEFVKSIRHMNVIEEEYTKAEKIRRVEQRKNRLKQDEKTIKKKEDYVQKVTTDNQNIKNVKKIKPKKSNINPVKPIKKKR